MLIAVRLEKEGEVELPPPFIEDDKKILQHFANHASIALRNTWLFKSAIWRPFDKASEGHKENVGERGISIGRICEKVVTEACEVTGATDSRVRFVDWQGKRLVPGFIKWPPKSIEKDQIVCCVRVIGVCPAGKAAEKKEPYRSGNLKKDEVFGEFLKDAKDCAEFYKQQSLALEKWNGFIQDKQENINDILSLIKSHISQNCSIATKKLEERFEVLKNKPNDYHEFIDLYNKQKKVVKSLTKIWKEYIIFLEKQNSEIAVPIQIGDKLLGVINVHSEREEWFTESDEAILRALAGRIATAIMVYQQEILNITRKIERQMMAGGDFNVIAESVSNGIKYMAFLGDHEEIFPLLYLCKIPVSPGKLLNHQSAFGENFKEQQREKASEEEIELLNIPISPNGLGYKAIEKLRKQHTDEPIFIVRENADDPISGSSSKVRKLKIKTTACLPLVFGGTVYGLLYIHIKERYFFTELEKETLTLFAAQAAIVVKNLKRRSIEDIYDSLHGNELIKNCIELK